jgi:hypothetical protein
MNMLCIHQLNLPHAHGTEISERKSRKEIVTDHVHRTTRDLRIFLALWGAWGGACFTRGTEIQKNSSRSGTAPAPAQPSSVRSCGEHQNTVAPTRPQPPKGMSWMPFSPSHVSTRPPHTPWKWRELFRRPCMHAWPWTLSMNKDRF